MKSEPETPKRVLTLGHFLLLLLTASGCSDVLGLDDYTPVDRGPSDASGAMGAVAVPVLPAQPDQPYVDRCSHCVMTTCAAQHEKCVGSERCRDMLRCMGPGGERPDGCSDPNCIAVCESKHLPSPYFDSLFACAFEEECATECGGGANWECVGDYSWDTPSMHPAVATVEFVDVVASMSPGAPLPAYSYLQASACNDGSLAENPPGDTGCTEWKDVDPFKGVELSFENHNAIALRSTFPGGLFLQTLNGKHRIYPRPISLSNHLSLSIVNGQEQLSYVDSAHADSKLGVVLAEQVDCLGVPASVDIDIPSVPKPAPPLTNEGHLPRLQVLDTTSTYFDNSLFWNVPPAQSVVVMSKRSDGTTVSRTSVLVAAEWFTAVFLYPRTRAEAGN